MPKPHARFRFDTPDEVAECMQGVSPELSSRLWSLMADLPRPTYHVEDSSPGDALDSDRGLASCWSKLTRDEQVELNRLAAAEERRDRIAATAARINRL